MKIKGWFILYFWLFTVSVAGSVVSFVYGWLPLAFGFAWSAYVWYRAMMGSLRAWALEERVKRG